MKDLLKDRLTISNYLCGILALVIIIMQCMPFWSFDYEYTYDVEEEVPVVEEATEDEEATAEEETAEAEEAATEEETAEAEEPETEIITKEVTEIKSATLSLLSYEWIPTSEQGVAFTEQYTKELGFKNAEGEDFGVNDIILAPVIQFVLALLAIGLCIASKKNIAISIITIIGSGYGLWGFLTNPALKIGNGSIGFVIVSAITALVGLVAFIFAVMGLIDRRKRRLAAIKNKSLEM